MHLQGIEYIQEEAAKPYFTAKMVFNAKGAIFFPVTREHRDMTGPDIRYRDNYLGNALAAMLAPDKIEIRFHQSYKDDQVVRIINSLKQQPDLSFLADWQVTYQGRQLKA
jgi:hypothetical protein